MYKPSPIQSHYYKNYQLDISEGSSTSEVVDSSLAEEVETALYIDDEFKETLVSSPHDLEPLIIGHALDLGYIATYSDVECVELTDAKAVIRLKKTINGEGDTSLLETSKSELSDGQSSNKNDISISGREICSYGGLLDSLSEAHHITHGVHEGAIVKDGKMLLYAEDVARHNVLDRLRGLASLQNIDLHDKILVFSGRVPQSVIKKVSRMGIQVILSRAMPTTLGLEVAKANNITVVNGLRPNSFKAYTHLQRINFE